ncbi:MAG: hypothetical protein KDK62_06360 [Chlamydiia bacterium]|nr:hypothetical protein [Chlamydiia bacterium]
MTLLLSSLFAGRRGAESLYDRNQADKEKLRQDYKKYLFCPPVQPTAPCDDDDDEEDDDY